MSNDLAAPMNSPCSAWGHHQQSELQDLCERLRALPEIQQKQAIRVAANMLSPAASLEARYAQPGDDCAAFKVADGYQLLAMEGMLPGFVAQDPQAAGWSSVMVNISDIAAMGGRATAVVNAFWHHDSAQAEQMLFHLKRACDFFDVTFAGGHSSLQPGYAPGLAVAIMGHAQTLLSCHHLRPGQRLFILTDLRGSWYGNNPYWGCVPGKTPEEARLQWHIPAELAEKGLAVAAKDISNGGILGTLLMMLELTGCGATLDISAISTPDGDLFRWLRAFQSFGFLLAVEPEQVSPLLAYFHHSPLLCQPIGSITADGRVTLDYAGATAEFWNIRQQPLTAMGVTDACS